MKMMLRRLAIVVCVTLALLSAAYAFAVLRTHSGTGCILIRTGLPDCVTPKK